MLRLSSLFALFLVLSLLIAACAGPAAPAATPAPTAAPQATDTPTPQAPAPTTVPTEPAPPAAAPGQLPDLGGRVVRAVTENAYVPLNFVDPRTGKAMGWEYDATEEICRRLNCRVEWNITSWDTMISAV
ncbi:MAG: transporter substrate-binding domain-containing protein, partial [Caldilineales bacterium]|nr:transporter substrate-binding domain-containing protein [Caldilineales bacterium]